MNFSKHGKAQVGIAAASLVQSGVICAEHGRVLDGWDNDMTPPLELEAADGRVEDGDGAGKEYGVVD